ncbi:Uncharacterised protein [Mycobacterium tuberculosis]|uniref:Uncharacterized protein n=1 Tax=Mycobacterium tuberculosis TaxID=1773 RepID=A0A655JAZ0_MYCTX|nr:hypothetical protein FF22_02315 [Mycobacterium tuberculosis]CFS02882.1 Uncharacterised protein [Mycobacterium tuberculosis]CKP54661.1 Uncharacterised protein [Mycobacterium tuberculosis]CKR48098.1 Uncharacterised protein [Mycobacterium tuberculosis]CKR88511.1 Uncharacterised protein [Mycobacterium tuberculosis]
MPVGDLTPVIHAGPAERVGADPHPGLANGGDIDHVRQVIDIVAQVVVSLGGA